jgi:hypothetical protein
MRRAIRDLGLRWALSVGTFEVGASGHRSPLALTLPRARCAGLVRPGVCQPPARERLIVRDLAEFIRRLEAAMAQTSTGLSNDSVTKALEQALTRGEFEEVQLILEVAGKQLAAQARNPRAEPSSSAAIPGSG